MQQLLLRVVCVAVVRGALSRPMRSVHRRTRLQRLGRYTLAPIPHLLPDSAAAASRHAPGAAARRVVPSAHIPASGRLRGRLPVRGGAESFKGSSNWRVCRF